MVSCKCLLLLVFLCEIVKVCRTLPPLRPHEFWWSKHLVRGHHLCFLLSCKHFFLCKKIFLQIFSPGWSSVLFCFLALEFKGDFFLCLLLSTMTLLIDIVMYRTAPLEELEEVNVGYSLVWKTLRELYVIIILFYICCTSYMKQNFLMT